MKYPQRNLGKSGVPLQNSMILVVSWYVGLHCSFVNKSKPLRGVHTDTYRDIIVPFKDLTLWGTKLEKIVWKLSTETTLWLVQNGLLGWILTFD